MPAWVWIVIVLHALVCLALIAAILLHSGRGAGLSDMLGGGIPTSFSGGSVIERNLDRITVGLCVTFGITSFVLMLALRVTASGVAK